ncbi:unnamed protein product [Prunus brigantina]
MPEDCVQRIIKVGKKSLPSVLTKGMEIDVNSAIISEDDWRNPIINYLQYPTLPSEKRIRIMALNYLMWNGDLVRKSKDEVLLRCLGKKEFMKIMGETHEGICGAHQGGRKMCWLIRRYGYFWPTMMKDCIDYSKGYEASTGMTPYALTYGHDAVLPMEIAVQSLRIAHQHKLVGEEYSQAMLMELEGLDASRIDTLNKLLARKQVVSRAYNKRVKNKSFEEGEIVWKAVLPLGTHIAGYGKWSPTWEGPFIVNQILGMGAYRLQDRDGEIQAAPINGKWLKKFYPTMWDSQVVQTDPGIEKEQV